MPFFLITKILGWCLAKNNHKLAKNNHKLTISLISKTTN